MSVETISNPRGYSTDTISASSKLGSYNNNQINVDSKNTTTNHSQDVLEIN